MFIYVNNSLDKVGKVCDIFILMIETKKILDRDIIAMDETVVWFNMVRYTTVETHGARSVPLKPTDEPLDCGSGGKSRRDQTDTFCGFQRRCQVRKRIRSTCEFFF